MPLWHAPFRVAFMKTIPSRSPLRTRPTRLACAIAQQSGFGLMEVLLTLGAVSVMSLAVYGLFFSSDVTAEVKNEQTNLNTLSTAIDRSFGLTGGFSGVSMSEVVAEGLLPSQYTRSGEIRTEWGSTVDVRANSVARTNDSFLINYSNVPGDACARLAAAMAPNVYDLRIGGTSVMTSTGLDPAAAASRCGSGAQMEFVYYSGLISGTAVATPALTLPAAPPSVDPANPTTPSSPVSGAPSVGGVAPAAPVAVTPGSPVAPAPAAPTAPPAPATPSAPQPTPASAPTTPPGTLAGCTVPPPTTGSQTVACSSGQYGQLNQQRTGTYSCPEAWEAPAVAWGGWTTTSGSCNACPGPATETNTQWVNSSASCPSGQVGSNTWQREQVQTRSRSYNCPAGTTSLPPPTYGGWSAWSDTGNTRNGSNTCAPACVAPAPSSTPISRSAPSESQTLSCPAGQTGSITQQRTRTENGTRTTTYTCPAPTGSPTSSTSDSWSGSYSYGSWTTTSNTCVTPAPACANATTSPFTLLRYRACTDSSGRTVSGQSAQRNPATNDYCTAVTPLPHAGGPHGANYSGNNNFTVWFSWAGKEYSCYYSAPLSTAPGTVVAPGGGTASIPGMTCASVSFVTTAQGWGSGLNIVGGPQYTTCP